jgi:hypothetical protein
MATNQGNKQSGNQGGTKSRGFASMDPGRQREIASEGGKAAHLKGTAHEFTSEEARRAGSMSHGARQSAEPGSRSESVAHSAGAKQGGSKQSANAGAKQGAAAGAKQSAHSAAKLGEQGGEHGLAGSAQKAGARDESGKPRR